MKILIARTKIQSVLKGGYVYAESMDKVKLIGESEDVGLYLNLRTNKTFPARKERVIEVEVMETVIERKIEAIIKKEIKKVEFDKPIKKKEDKNKSQQLTLI